jgi:RimJ/RimL family protein N-acetyltransferase
MGIVRAYRGRGLGTRLINATLEAAFGAGFVRVELDVHADNARAISLYERVGFVREGIVRDAVYVDGEYRDAITMALIRRLKV